MVAKLIMIACGGALGALLRFGLSHAMNGRWHKGFPWGTLAANLLGAFLIGLLMTLFTRLALPERWQPLVTIGFLGALTTFSTFTYEVHSMLEDNRFAAAAVYWFGSNSLGILLVFAGVALGRAMAPAS